MKWTCKRIPIASVAAIILALLITIVVDSGGNAIAKDPPIKPAATANQPSPPQSAPLRVVVTNMEHVEEIPPGKGFMFSFVAHNASGKDIRAYKGTIVIRDLFGDVVLTYPASVHADVKNGQSEEGEVGWRYDAKKAEEVMVRYTDFRDLQFNFCLEEIVYENGEVVKIPLPKRLQGR
ncbi:MAG: hypothetical protein SGJ20_17105 [Planctomycetota bacterium]|nr:hypothetical protein [Planctomycetota bacterium]